MATRIPITKDSFGFENRQDDIWKKMEDDMERRRKEWENEIEKMSTDFFSMKTDRPKGRFEPMADRLGIAESYDDGKSVIEKNEHGQAVFKARFNVKDYKPEEVNVKMDANKIIVQAKHEENTGGASVSREYSREVNIPSEIDPMALQCTISQEGVLTVEAPLPTSHCLNVGPGSSGRDETTPSSTSVPAPDYLNVRPGSSDKTKLTQSSTSVPAPDYLNERPGSSDKTEMTQPSTTVPAPDYLNERPGSSGKICSTQSSTSVPNPDYVNETHASSGKYGTSLSSNSNNFPHHSGTSSPAAFQQQRVATPPFKPQPVHVTSTPVTHSQQFQTTRSSGQVLSPSSSAQFQQPQAAGHYSEISDAGPFQPPPYQGQGPSFSTAQPMFNQTTMNTASQRTASPTNMAGKRFKIETDIEDFNPEDLTVKTVDKKIMITARKEEKNGNRTSTREMTREFHIPETVDPYTVKAFFTDAGKLILEAPYRPVGSDPHSNGSPHGNGSFMTSR